MIEDTGGPSNPRGSYDRCVWNKRTMAPDAGRPHPRAADAAAVRVRRQTITFIDGDRGILRYRGYPLEHLAERSHYLEVAYLILAGELPTKAQYDCGNSLQMMFKIGDYQVNPVLERALEVLFILHADHEQNCSTSAMRSVGSSAVDPYSAAAAAIGALYGPLHGGANEAVLRMLREIGSKDRVPEFIKSVKQSEGEVKLMGFGHRVYKNYDPRALELERIALEDDYFLIYQAMGFPVDIFPVLFAIPRMSGWLAQWEEMLEDEEQKIARPRQVYLGAGPREYVAAEARR
jgi:citrate synthase